MTLEARVQRLEDQAEIQTLLHRYGQLVDQGWEGRVVDAAGLREVYAPFASWRCDALGIDVTGIEAIVESLIRHTQQVDFAMHAFSNAVITIEGDAARGQWLLWTASRWRERRQLAFLEHEAGFVRMASGWRISSVRLWVGESLVGGTVG